MNEELEPLAKARKVAIRDTVLVIVVTAYILLAFGWIWAVSLAADKAWYS